MISVYGASGFIGSKFCEIYPNSRRMGKNEISPPEGTTKVLYLISTVDNYNVLVNAYIDIETNLIHLMRVLESCKNRDIEFVFVSSWFVYGNVPIPAKESSYCDPKGFYSITKRTAEQLIESYCNTFNISYKIIRLGNVVGKTDSKVSKKKNALQYLINEMKEHRDINLYEGGDFYRDFVHVEDVVKGFDTIINRGEKGEIYNLGSCQSPVLFKDIIDYAHIKLNSKSKIGSMEPTNFHKIIQTRSIHLDCSKLIGLGFTPSYSVFESIDSLL